MNVKPWVNKSQEVAQNLHMLKFNNSIVLQKEELWIFIFWSFLVHLKDFFFHLHFFWMNNENDPSCCLWEMLLKKRCLAPSSQCSRFTLSSGWKHFYSLKFSSIRSKAESQEFALFRGGHVGSTAGVRVRCSLCQLIFDLWMFQFRRLLWQRGDSGDRPTSARVSSAFAETTKLPILFFWTWEVKSRLLKEWERTQCTTLKCLVILEKKDVNIHSSL